MNLSITIVCDNLADLLRLVYNLHCDACQTAQQDPDHLPIPVLAVNAKRLTVTLFVKSNSPQQGK